MLGARVATALVLLAILLPAIFVFPPLAWGLLTLAFLAVGAWEWARLLPGGRAAVCSSVLVAAGLAALAWRAFHPWPRAATLVACGLLAIFWIVLAPMRLHGHDVRRGGWPLAAALLFGCWLSLMELRILGAIPLLSSMAVVWIADIAAYFVGRATGKHKLAATISPGKTWEGAIGGLVAVVVVGLAVTTVPALGDSIAAVIANGMARSAVIPVLLAMAALSIIGDLYESLLKRQAGAKDSGWVLPGHGGVLDRIDALIPTMPVALGLYVLLR